VAKRKTISVVAEQITGLLTLSQVTGIQAWSLLLSLKKDVKTGIINIQHLPLSHFHFYVWSQEFHHHVHLDNMLVLNKACRQPKDDPSL
jgi:hypothetical protein